MQFVVGGGGRTRYFPVLSEVLSEVLIGRYTTPIITASQGENAKSNALFLFPFPHPSQLLRTV